ncbi:MAG TPA: ATP-binding protein [Syntrophales bacterium]|nr:ATP-binding protein [Syntrophales bacterium]HPI56800.1 ATP-binding protein [Syntrophales bacterium]HPN25762.1 ATP-binding protein [Syntrophales bacterium]HQM28727.1 ATP-binding protein [Syntrophales bacterium]
MGAGGSRKIRAFLSPWVIVGTVLILAAIFVFMARESIHKQRELTTRLLVEQGSALIQSFEASARTGAWMKWGPFQLQKLLIEMARQPGIDYLTVTDTRGVILADSDPAMVGEFYDTGLDLENASRLTQVQWRQVSNREGTDTFEVYRRFAPTEIPFGDSRDGAAAGTDSPDLVIFVGLDMGPVLAARDADLRSTVTMAVVLVLAGFAGILALLLAQGYLSTRSSYSRVKAFSDSLVENMPIGLVALDGGERVMAFNVWAESILGRAAGEVIGRSAAEVLPDTCHEILGELQRGEGVIERETECRVSVTKTVPLEVIATTLKEEGGRPQGSVILFRDLTEIRQLKAEIARSQRLASIGSLAAGVAHEIRNPLSSIKGFATYFKAKLRGDPEDSRTADIMIQEVERLNRVIRQLLDLSRPMEIEKKPTRLEPLIEHTVRLADVHARKKGIIVRTEFSPEAPAVFADPDRIKQVLLNLCLNAIEAMQAGGNLTLTLGRYNEKMARLDVSDTGAGVPRGDLENIFDPYYTTKSSGTGLGLAIVHRIVEAHGGEIRVRSESGRGTTFTMLLPVSDEAPAGGTS